jgi:glucan phosphoethanolaminetransferase (alkaline phosphatase superfamily)
MDEVYSVREQIYNEIKDLASDEYIAYFSDHAQSGIERNGYKTVPSKDGLGYTLQKLNPQNQ